MRSLSDTVRGVVRLEVFGAFPESLLNTAAGASVELWNAESAGEHRLRFDTYERRLVELEALAQRCGCELRVLRRRGGSISLRFARRRAGLLLGLLVVCLLLFVSSLFIWRIEIRGNSRLSRGELLRALEDCGVGIGCFWPGTSPDLVRSRMMLRVPEIGWMTVNVSGSRAVVLISERREKPEIYRESEAADLVASKSGVVRRVSVLAGRGETGPGQAVCAGELLVSGSRSGTGPIRARGSVMAETWPELVAVCPLEEEQKRPSGIAYSRFALVFGKRRVNLYFDGGKAIDAYDKIISEKTLGVEGLFSLPLRLVRERIVPCARTAGCSVDRGEMERRLYAVLDAATEGQILRHSFSAAPADGLFVLTLRAHCIENIAVTQPAEA